MTIASILLSVAFATLAGLLCVKIERERGTRRARKELETLIKNNNNGQI